MVCVGTTHPTEQCRTRLFLLASSSTAVAAVATCAQRSATDIELQQVGSIAELLERVALGRVDVAMVHVTESPARGQYRPPDLRGLPSLVPVVALCEREDEDLLANCFAHGAQECVGLSRLDAAQLTRVLRFAHIRSKVACRGDVSLGQVPAVCEKVVMAMDDGIVVVDHDGRVVLCNPAAELLLGEELPAVAEQELRAGSVIDVTEEVERKLPCGRVVGLKTARVPWLGDGAQLLRVRDATRQCRTVGALKRTNRRLARANRRLVESGQSKDELVANASHELRTPLTAIRSSLDAMPRPSVGTLTDRQAELHAVALRNVDRLARLIEDLLDLSRLEAGQERLHISAFSLSDAVRDAATAVLPLAAGKSIVLTVNADEDLPRFVGDRAKIDQVVTNLLTNAIKFTGQGGRVSVQVHGDAPGEHDPRRPTFTITVADTGIGIPPDQLARVFDRFHRGDDPRAQRQRGTGLGLAIVRRLVHMHQGDVSIVSTAERGTVLTVTLPRLFADDFLTVQLGNSLLRARSARQPLSIVRVALRDEGVGAARAALLEAICARVQTALHRHNDGVHARARDGEVLAVLPQTTRARAGTLLKRVRASLSTMVPPQEATPRPAAAAVLVGAATFPHDGVELDRLLARAAASAALVHIGVDPSAFDILVIDDNDTLRTLVLHLLADGDYSPRTARDGSEGLAMACAQPPDLVVLDLLMRHMDGRRVLEGLTQQAHLAHVPVLVLGGDVSADVERLCAGRRSALLTRPFGKEALLDSVRCLLEPRMASGGERNDQQDSHCRGRRGYPDRYAGRHGGGGL